MTKEKVCEIISVGTELLLGQIDDTNSTWLSRKMATLGMNVFYRQTVGDNQKRLYQAFELAQSRSDLVIVTGGLGPTEDDLTRHAACDLFGCSLETDTETMGKIETFYLDRDLPMTENNRKQALTFEGALVFQNQVGMAPGLCYEFEGTYWFFLPGVPTEMKWLVENELIPYLYEQNEIQHQIFSRELIFQGIGESALETELMDLIRTQTNPTIAPLAGGGHVMVRLTAKSSTEIEAEHLLDALEKKILYRISDYYVGNKPMTPERQLVDLLNAKEATLSSCESLTGGMFASHIVAESGASEVFDGAIVSYTNEIKESVVGISHELLNTEGPVSEEVARSMAEKTKSIMNSNFAISFTGVAGEESMDGHPSGTVLIAVAGEKESICESLHLYGNRNEIRENAVQQGFKKILNFIKST